MTHRWPCRPAVIERWLCARGMSRSKAKRMMREHPADVALLVANEPEIIHAAEQAHVQADTLPTPTTPLARGLRAVAGVLRAVADRADGKAHR